MQNLRDRMFCKWFSDGHDYDGYYLLGWDAMQSDRNVPTLQKSFLPLKSIPFYPDDGGSLFLRSIGTCSPSYTVSYCRRLQSCCVNLLSFLWFGMHVSTYAKQVGANGDVYDLYRVGSCFESRPGHPPSWTTFCGPTCIRVAPPVNGDHLQIL